MKKILFGLLLISLVSCRTMKESTKVVIKDSTSLHDSTVLVCRDSTIYVVIPVDSITIRDSIVIKDGQVVSFPKRIYRQGLITTILEITNGNVMVNSWINQDSISVTIKNARISEKTFKNLYGYYYQKSEETKQNTSSCSFWIRFLLGAIAGSALTLIIQNKLKLR